mmetsp:Transcript_13565/g.32761  ORF Transcript_13565/g.32761 Transcript_13565/m.32761 type:complete len:500 (-) Transcript_13565:145-1644(-)
MKFSCSLFLTALSIDAVSAQNPGPCTLCIDGSEPPFLENKVFDFGANNSTCADFAAGAAAINVDSEETFLACRQLQDVGLSNCGCTTPEALKTGCTLCPGGNELLPNPDQEVIPLVTCGGIGAVVERFEEEECRAYQQVIGGMCACPDAPTTNVQGKDTCRICVDRQVDFPANPVDLSEFGLDAVPCAFFETIANQDDETPCSGYQLNRANCCEMPSAPPNPPANLAEICTAAATDLQSYFDCANACIEASCCEDTCSTDFTCFAYLPCAVLEAIDPPEEPTTDDPLPSLPSPPSNLGELCAVESISGDLVAYLTCINACTPATCCEDTCATDAACLQYVPCLVLDTVATPEPNEDGPAVTPPSNLAELCAADNVSSDFDAYLGCLGACLPGSCCGGACSTDLAICIQYAPCAILDTIDEPPFGQGGGGITSAPVAPPVTDAPMVAAPTTAPVAAPTAAPVTAPTAAPDSAANGHSGLLTTFRLVMSLLCTLAAVAVAE